MTKKRIIRLTKIGLVDLDPYLILVKAKIKDPVIVSCTDGVGTKIELANQFKKFDTIGIDLVAMCVNDLIVQCKTFIFFRLCSSWETRAK